MFTADENAELDEQAVSLAYDSILLSGLYHDLESDQWDALAVELATKARALINEELQQRIDALATENDYTTLVTE